MPENEIIENVVDESTVQDSTDDISIESKLEATTQLLNETNATNKALNERIKKLEVELAKVSLRVDVSAQVDEDKAFLAFDKYSKKGH